VLLAPVAQPKAARKRSQTKVTGSKEQKKESGKMMKLD